MLDRVAVVRHRVGRLHLVEGVQQHVDGLVSVGVGVYLEAGPVVGGQTVGELVRRDEPDSVGATVLETRPAQACGSALDRAVQQELDLAAPEVVG